MEHESYTTLEAPPSSKRTYWTGSVVFPSSQNGESLCRCWLIWPFWHLRASGPLKPDLSSIKESWWLTFRGGEAHLWEPSKASAGKPLSYQCELGGKILGKAASLHVGKNIASELFGGRHLLNCCLCNSRLILSMFAKEGKIMMSWREDKAEKGNYFWIDTLIISTMLRISNKSSLFKTVNSVLSNLRD